MRIKKLIVSFLLIVLILISLFSGSRNFVFENPLFSGIDGAATKYIDDALIRAGTAYVLSRSFNAVVSVFQESELQFEPGGVGISFAIGQWLDPINDLVERFSVILLASLTSLGIQKVLIEIAPWLSFNIIFVLALSAFLCGIWVGDRYEYDFLKIGKTLLWMVFIVRFAVPGMAYLNNQVYISVLEKRHDEAISEVGAGVNKIKINEGGEVANLDRVPEEERGWYDKAKSIVGQTIYQGKNLLDLREKLDEIKEITTNLFDKIVDLIVVFVINTMVLPLAFLWGIIKLGKLLIRRDFGEKQKNAFFERMKMSNA